MFFLFLLQGFKKMRIFRRQEYEENGVFIFNFDGDSTADIEQSNSNYYEAVPRPSAGTD